MQKKAVIFADQNQEDEEPVSSQKPITLSRNAYREVVKEAYQEGIQDAKQQKEQEEQTSQQKSSTSNEQKNEIRSTNEKEGEKEAVKSEAQKSEENKQRVKTISARQDIELLRTKSMFPFSFFPDTLIIDTTKITIAKKQFFATENISTIPLKDIGDVTVQTALFLASVTMKYMPQTESAGMTKPIDVTITALPRNAAIRAKNILKGAMVAKAEEIDIAKLTPKEVQSVLEKFGHSEGVI